MDTKIVTTSAKGNAREAGAALVEQTQQRLEGANPALVIAFASTDQPLGELMPVLVDAFPGATVIGASTAGEFTEMGDAKRSAALFALVGDFRVVAGMGTGLKANVEAAVKQAVSDLPPSMSGYPHRTGILLVDPLAGNGEEATLIASTLLGDIPLAGGAAGDDLKMKSTEVACGRRAESDAVVAAVIFSKERLGVGVCHGHEPISPPLRVTRAQANVVVEVDGRPAWKVWEEQTRASAAQRQVDPSKLSESEVGSFLLRYEAGLSAGDSYKIRAPLARNADGSIAFACGIPEGAVIRITESVPERQIDSARKAAQRARDQLGDREVAGAVVFDCICRNLILSDEFQTAVRAMSEELGGAPLAGFETYGEIALQVGELSGFHNTTTVVLAFPK